MAWLIDKGYKNTLKAEERSIQQPAPVPPVVIKDTAEEDRLRRENEMLKQQLDERAKRRSQRQQIAKLIHEGNTIMQQALSTEPPPNLLEGANNWAKRVYNYLETIDASFAARFNAAIGPAYSHGAVPQVYENIWNFVNPRCQVLGELARELHD